MNDNRRETLPVVVTIGEPAGVGPELVVQLLQQEVTGPLCIAGDPDLLLERAALFTAPQLTLPD